MGSMRQNVIDLSSSSDPSTHRMSHARPKFKSKQKPRILPVIELTDDDDDTPNVPPKATPNALAGPSFHSDRAAALQPKSGPSGLFENIPNTPTRKLKASIARPFPLFLPSDEENEPPSSLVPVSPVVERISPFELDDMEDAQAVQLPTATEVVQPRSEADPTSTYVARVLEIIPDVDRHHLLDLIARNVSTHGDQVVEHVLHCLFEDPTYPKIDKKGKGKRMQSDGDAEGYGAPLKKTKIDYKNKERPFKGGVHYTDIALEHLQSDFQHIPKAYLRKTLATFNGLYAPTFFFLKDQDKQHKERQQQNQVVKYPYTRQTTQYHPSKKGKTRAIYDAEFELEHAWLIEELAKDDQEIAEKKNEDEYEDCGDGIECGCCFSTYPFDKMIQCPEAHLFCNSCMTSYASTLLGSHDTNIKCMHQSGCTVAIPRSELQRFLPEKLMVLWERLTQRKEVQAAGLDGWEECPFCEWGCVIENAEEKLFRCENIDGCGVVSCRGCKKLDHLPKSCKEVEEDKNLDGRHAIEEAMTRALMRNCPKCQKAFIKEYGCNKMSCPECGTLSCYVCRKAVTGYDHFIDPNASRGAPGYQGSSQAANKCVLYDAVEQRHADEVKEAAERALEKYKQEHPDIDETAIKVDLPPAPPIPQAAPGLPLGLPQLPHMDINAAYHQHGAALQIHLQILHQQLQVVGQQVQANVRMGVHQEQPGAQFGNAARAYHGMHLPAVPAVPVAAAPQEANLFVNAHQVHNHAQPAAPRVGGGLAPLPAQAMRRNPPRNQQQQIARRPAARNPRRR